MGHCGSPRFSSPDLSFQRGVRYTYRYRTTITTTLHGSSAGRNGLALDCVVDIDVVSKCHLIMQIRNPQIKRLSPQKEHSVQRLKSLRDSLERTRLKFSLQGGKVTALCLQEGEQVWALNIKRALLSMLQTSRMTSKQELEKETDVFGTCTSRYERRGPVLLKSRDLKQCHQSRLENFWPHSVSVADDTSMQSELHCVQRHGPTVLEEVNCTEAVSMAEWSRTAGLVKTQTVSTLLLLRAQPGTPPGADSLGPGVLTGLQFEDEGAAGRGRARTSTLQHAIQTVRMLCSLNSDPQQVSQEFLQLAFQLRYLTLSQLRALWQEASFKCRNDWQPLLDALPACGSENCILLLTDLMRNKELEEEPAHAFLTTIALIPHPSPQIISSINVLLAVPELRSKALLAGSTLVYQMCKKSQTPCSELLQVQTFIQTLEDTLKDGCGGEQPTEVKLLYALKSVGNIGLSAPTFTPLINCIMLLHSSALELRLAAIKAFRRFPCSADRSVLLQLYGSSQEDPEVRIAAYQQIMRCPDRDVFQVVKTMLKTETSSQVGSYVWSHLTNVLRSEDPMKQTLIESLPDDIISRDFEAEFMKYSSYSDYTFSSGLGVTNVETSLVFSPKSFLPRSATANLTVYFHGRAHNLLEVDLHVENAEPLLKNMFGDQTSKSDGEPVAQSPRQSKEAQRTRRKTDDEHGEEKCLSSTVSYLDQARAMLFRRRTEENRLKCWLSVKVFGNELSVFTCDDLHNQMNQLSLSAAGLAVKLLKGQEVQLNHRAVLMTEELILPSLSGLPIKLGINMTSLLSLRLKGNVNYRDTSHFSLTGYIKPNAHVGLSARMGVDGALGAAAVDWVSELRSSTSLDGSVQLQEGRDLRVTLNTPEDVMDIFSVSSRVFQLSGDHREEIKGPKSQVQKTTCTPKTWSKMVGWQLCSNASYPLPATGVSLPPPGPVHLSLRLLKLDRGLHYYLLEAAYSLLPQRGTWLPREANLHLLLATPQSSIPRDMSLDLTFNPRRLLLRITHPLKTILIQGHLEQERKIKSGKLELLIDGVHYYIMGLVDTQSLLSEQRTRYHLEAKMAAHGHPMILSANVTRGLGRKTSFSATVKNMFRETASLSVALERRRDSSSRQYSVEAELLLPGVVGTRMLGLMEQKGSLWSSALRLKYGLGGEARHLRQDCYTSQRLRSERDSNLTYITRADHEFYCSNTAPINHKIHFKHEESPQHIKSALDVSYGKHWDEINNKRTLLLSQSFKNQTTPNHTSYTLEFSLQVPEKNLNYRTQLLHSHLRQLGSESSTHLKVNYNNLMPLVAGLHWKSPPREALQKKWEGTFNMDTPWLYIYTAHKLSQQQHHTLQLTSELTASKWLSVRNLLLEGFYRDRGREKEARLQLYTPAVTFIQAGGWGLVGKRSVKASGSFSSMWTPPIRGEVSLEASKLSHTLQMSSTYGRHNVSLTAALNTADKNLKKRQAILKMTFSKPKSPSTDFEFEGVVEELRRDKKMYQKTAMLHLRQPFQTFPQTLLLRETFTIDLLKGLYILESKAGFHGVREVIHTLTVGYRPPSPFVCSALVHPFSSDMIPSDSEICVTITSNQTQKDVKAAADISTVAGRGSSSVHVRADGKDRVKLDAQMSHSLFMGNRALGLRVNISQSLLPSATDLHVNMAANMSSDSVSLHGSYKQGHEALLAEVKGSLKNTRGLQLAVSGDLRHSMANLVFLPPVLGLDGALGQYDNLIEGQLRVRVMEALYNVELRHHEDPGESLDKEDEEGMLGNKLHVSHDWLCVWFVTEHLCVNVSRRLGGQGMGEVYMRLSHSFNLLHATGVPANSSAQGRWVKADGRLSVQAELQAGPENVKAEFNGGKTDKVIPRWEYFSRLQHQVKALLKRGVSSSMQAKAHYQGTVLPVSMALQGLLSVSSCQLTLTSSLRADEQDVSLQLSQSCRPPHLSGTLTHSFAGLHSHGVPQTITIEATPPVGPDQAGALFIKAGTCSIRADRVIEKKGRRQWMWALESTCPMLQAHLNGSVWQDPQGIWTFTVDTNLEGKRGFLRLNARAWPELSVEGELSHNLPSIRHLPQLCRLRVINEAMLNLNHSVPLLKMLGVPGLCSIQGVFPRLQSRAQLSLDRHKLLASGLNVSVSDGRLALLLSYSPPASNLTGTQQSLDATLTAQFKGPLRSASVDIHRNNWRVVAVGDVGGWGAHGGSKEARVTLRHTMQGQSSPTLQVEAWGRMTESQLRCSVAVNPERTASLALIIQGHQQPHSKDLMVKMVQNIPRMLVYLPPQLNVRSQLNQSESSVGGLMEVLSGRRRLWALGELAAIESGYRQNIELKHSYPQLKPLPRTVAVRTVYESRNWSYQVQHGAVWGNQEFSVSGLYSAPPALELGNQTLKIQISCVPRWTSLEVTLERFSQGHLDSVLLGWMRHGRLEQVRALSSWSRSEEMNETKLELKQPFSSTLSQMSLHTLTQRSHREQRSSHTTHMSWDSTVPVNISIILNRQWQNNSSRGQACALLSTIQSMLSTQQVAVSSVKGCVSVGQEGNTYSQNAELRWDNRSIKQSMKYQKGPRGMHSLQVNVGLDKVSPTPCPSQTLLTKIQTNLRDRLEHTVLLGLCPPQPTLSWSGSHRVNSAEELFYTQSRLSVTGRPHLCSLTFALTNSSTAQGYNMSLFSESRMGNWSVELGASALSWQRGSGLQVQARLDCREKIWLNGSVEGRCLRTTAGYVNGLSEDVTITACVGTNHSLMLDVQKRDGRPETLGRVSVGSDNQRLMLRASGCLKSLTAVEARIQYLSSQIQNKLLERIKTLQHLLAEFRRQSRDSELLQELSAVPLHVSQRAEALLGHRDRGLLALWQSSLLRRIVTDSLPRFLHLLQHASLLGQQELRRPLATLAGVYQDVKGQRPEALWREAVSLWTDGLVEVLPAVMENPQLRPLAQAGVAMLSVALDMAGQQTYHWGETRLTTALSGVRKRLASVYKFSPSECSVILSVPLPSLPWSRVTQAGLVEIVLEEWLLRPLQSLASVRPVAELYRLKRKIMDSPFRHQALLVADQFVVTFDGHLYELPGSCPLLLAQDVSALSSFTLLLSSDPNTFLLIGMDNSTIHIQRNGQVKANCIDAVTHTFQRNNGVAVRRGSNVVQVSSQNGVSVSCDLLLQVCSFTLDGWLHGTSTGLLGTNDNEAGNDFPLPDGSQAENMDSFFHSWQMKPEYIEPSGVKKYFAEAASSPVSCDFLFSSPDSPLSSCFRVVGPSQFLSVCDLSSSKAPCRLASAFVHICQQNYISLEVPVQCLKV
uniref:uncharacterized protein n=1 Tax=Semicossyphus pulcher TaxID=241346 RepID=UPI0037E98E19